MKNGRQKIPSKKHVYDILVNERKVKTLKEIGSMWNISKARVGQICKEFGITDKPYRVRGCGGYVNG
jgi:hypothetical protein